MKVLLWSVTAVTALFWTLGAWIIAAALGWAAGLAAPGDSAELARVIGSWSLPAWITWWIDPGLVSAVLGGIVWTLEQAQGAWPWIGPVVGWLVPLTWIVWGLGLGTMLVLALIGHWAIGRLQSPPARPAVQRLA